jgi:hypothetical protein
MPLVTRSRDREHPRKVVIDVEPVRRRDGRYLEADAGTKLAQRLAEPVVVHAPARFTEQVPGTRLVDAAVLGAPTRSRKRTQ